ncbi:MAG TPA: peptidylprolyl isomerase [Acidimicrobiales bacterium]
MGTAKRERQKQNRQLRLEELQREQAKKKRNKTIIRVGIIVAVAVIGLVAFSYLTGDDEDGTTATTTSTTTDSGSTTTVAQGPFAYGTGECPPAEGAPERVATFTAAPKQCIDPAKTYTATLDTSEGKIVVKLDTARTPGTTNNFVVLSRFKYYDGTKVFRTDPSIDIIQGGGMTNTDSPGYTIPDEGGKFTYTEGDFTMARTSAPNSAGGQWFFSTGPNTAKLDSQGTYVTFGKVTEGMDVVKAIIGLHQAGGQLGGAPSRDVIVKTVTITES